MKIKKCPFCGSERVMLNSSGKAVFYWVICDSCEAEGPSASTKKEAVEEWNAARRDEDEID